MAEDNPYLALAPGLPIASPDDDPYAALIPPSSGKFKGVLGSVDSTETLSEYTPQEIAALEAEAAGLPAPATPLGEVAPTEVRFNSPLVSYDAAGLPDYSAALGQAEEGGLGKIGLRALVGRAPSIIANAIEVPATVNEALTRALGMEPSDTGLFGAMRNSLRSGADAVRELGYEQDMDAVGYGAPSVSGGELVAALNPAANGTLGERAKAVGTFIPETLVASAPDMAATLNPLTLGGYVASRTNEVAKNRAANDNRQDVTLGDVGIAAPAAVVEALLERFTTMRLLPHGTTMATPGAREAVVRIAKELGLQSTLGGTEEVVPYLAENAGTETGATARGALETFVGGAVAEGAMGAGAQGIKEVAASRPAHIPTPTVAPNAAPRAESIPAAASEPVAAPLGEVTPAPIPQTAPLGAPEDTSDIDAMLAGVLGDPEVAAALDLPPSTPPADAVLGTPVATPVPGGVVATPDPDAAFRRPATALTDAPSVQTVTPPSEVAPAAPLPDLGEQTTAPAVQALADQSAPVSASADLVGKLKAARTARKAAPEIVADDDAPAPRIDIRYGKPRKPPSAAEFAAREEELRSGSLEKPANGGVSSVQSSRNGAEGQASIAESRGVGSLAGVERAAELSGQPSPLEPPVNGVSGHSKVVRDLLVSEPFRLQGLGSLDAPSQRMVLDHVLRATKDLKVRRAIVELLPVDVMNVLRREKLSPEDALHNEAVLKKLLSADSDGSVAVAVDVANALEVAIADGVAKSTPASKSIPTDKSASALSANEREIFRPSHEEIVTQNTIQNGDIGEKEKRSRARGSADADALGLREAVREVLGDRADKIEYLHGYDGLPEKQRKGVQARAEKRGGRGKTAALYDPKTRRVYLFTDVVTSPSRAAFHAAHEIAGHEGLRTLLGDGLNRALDIALQNPTVENVAKAIAGERNLAMDTEAGRLLAAEEALAELAAAVRTGDFAQIESRYKVPVPEGIRATLTRAIDNFLKRLKAAMEDVFGRHQFSDEDVRALLENAWQAVNEPAVEVTDGDALESVATDQTDTPAFRKWFGDSKVVDAEGRPLVVYHGTGVNSGVNGQYMSGDFDSFDRMLSGHSSKTGAPYGSFFFTNDPEVASSYTVKWRGDFSEQLKDNANVMPVYLSIQKPLRISAKGENWRNVVYKGEVMDVNDVARLALKSGKYDGVIVTRVLDHGVGKTSGKPSTTYIAFNPAQIKSATGNSGGFDAGNPSILESTEDPAAGTQRKTVAEATAQKEATREKLAGELPVSRGTPGWNYDSGAWEGRKGQANRMRTELQDKMLPWRDAQNQIESQLQAALPDAQNVYRIENLMHGRVSEGIDRIENDQIVPLVAAMKAAKVKPETLEEYLYARHAKERNAQIAEINPRMPDGGSGMTNAEADKILAGADKDALEPLSKRVDAITRSTRKRLLASGLITQEQFDGMESQYSAYVPLRGKATTETDFETGSGVAGRGIDSRAKPVKAALGRGAGNRAVNILGEVIGDAQRSVVVAEKARVGRAVMRIVLANPNPNLWTVEPVQTERKQDANGEVYDAVVNDWSDPSIVAVRHKGKLYKVEIQNQPMAQALNNVGVDQLGSVTRAAGAINRYLSAVLTKYNPAFVPVNATRDALFGLTGLAVEKGEAVALEAALSYPKAILAAGRSAANKPGSGEWDAFAKEFAEAGGKTGYVNMPSAEDLARKIGTGKLTGYSPDGLMKAARVIADTVGVLNDAVENALRLSAYGTLRKRGESAEAAAEYAKNLTVNFNRKGLSGSKLNAWFLFYNAALQGAHRTSKLLRKPKTYAYLGALAGAQVVATMAAMGMADDDGEPLWNKVPDHVKRRNLVIVLPSGHLITIPMPYGFNLFTYMSGRVAGALANNARGDDKPSETAGAITASLLSAASESFLPVPLGDGAMGLLPTVLRVPVNVQTNQNDFGRPIRDEAPFAKSDVPRASMGKPDTLELFKLASTGLNRMGGGDDLTPPAMSWFDRAPEDLEYLLGEVTGGTGQFIVDVASGIQKATGDEPATWRDVPITKRFATQIDDQAAQAALFYDRRETIDRSLKRVRSSFEQEGEEAAEALLASYPELKGAKFKRRKGDGTVIVKDGRPQIVVGDEDAVFGRYKAAEKAISERNEAVEAAYANSPAAIIPTERTRERDASIRTSNIIRETAQNQFNTAWVRDVVGAAE